MSEHEINLLMTVMQEGFRDVKGAIKDSREELQKKITAVHERINDIDRNAVRRDEHARDLADLRQEVLLRSKAGSRNGSFWGAINTPSWRITGLCAVIVSIAIAWVVMRGYNIL
jgi:hypothetical protein